MNNLRLSELSGMVDAASRAIGSLDGRSRGRGRDISKFFASIHDDITAARARGVTWKELAKCLEESCGINRSPNTLHNHYKKHALEIEKGEREAIKSIASALAKEGARGR
jgi:hypothetical protein